MRKINIAFELLVLMIILGSLLFILGIKSHFNPGNVNTETSNLEGGFIEEVRRDQLCKNDAPEYANSLSVEFEQKKVNGEWLPKEVECEWRCYYGFDEVGGSCVDRDECSLETDTCSTQEQCKNTDGGYLCMEPRLSNSLEGIKEYHEEIYSSYPATNEGKESMYPFLSDGDTTIAKDMTQDIYHVSNRYEPVKIEEITWNENPYDERYWRYIYYSLRPTRHLLYAWESTGNDVYLEKLTSIFQNFVDNSEDSPYLWDDKHKVAYRTMVLINTWWSLREKNELNQELGLKMLPLIEEHGEFLEREENYEKENNHGVTQAAALYLIGVNFPDFPKSERWRRLGAERSETGVNILFDKNGALVENSPYYHFLTLRLYWQIYEYSRNHDLEISDTFKVRIDEVVNYATYILQPDREVPLYGASLKARIENREEYAKIAEEYPEFLYVLTEGKEGEKPKRKSIYFPYSGQTLMRSGWDEGAEFRNQTYLLFDTGNYRTDHSELDALSFHLYGNSQVLLSYTGLYTYEENTKYWEYYHDTRGQNTVMVDDKDQRRGRAIGGKFFEGDNYTYHSGKHALYSGVIHKRAILLIDKETVIVIDLLNSDEPHNYSLLYHFSPEIDEMSRKGLTLRGYNEGDQVVSIQQFHSQQKAYQLQTFKGQSVPYRGWCSYQYEVAIPCYEAEYKKLNSQNAEFVSGIDLSGEDLDIKIVVLSEEKIILNVKNSNKVYNVIINHMVEDEELVEITEVHEE